MSAPPPPSHTWVAGVDGCPGGWLVVMRPLSDPAASRIQLVQTFAEVLGLEPRPSVIGIDMPIGLPPIAGIGGRRADVEARANLGKRQSSIFAVPSRAAVMEHDYRTACGIALQTSDPPRKISKQCFFLFPKIRQIDALMTPALQSRIYETHPEVAFWALNRGVPLDEPKKVKSRPYPPGLEQRRSLLTSAGYDRAFLQAGHGIRARDAAPDDLLDATVCSWTAARIARGEGCRFPLTPSLDAKGLRMEIWG